MESPNHVYEALPLNNIGVYNNPTTFIPNKAYGARMNKSLKELELSKPYEDEYVEIQGGVQRKPEEIYDIAVHNTVHMRGEESEEEQYDEAFDPESYRETCTNL